MRRPRTSHPSGYGLVYPNAPPAEYPQVAQFIQDFNLPKIAAKQLNKNVNRVIVKDSGVMDAFYLIRLGFTPFASSQDRSGDDPTDDGGNTPSL